MSERLSRTAASVLVAIATAIVILSIAIIPFLSPAWVSFEQGRSDAAAWTGYSPSQLQAATGAILSDLVFGPPNFDVQVNGPPVLNPRERGHMADVRRVFVGLAILAVASAVLLLVAGRLNRGRMARPVRAGVAGLAISVVAIGLVGAFAFDLAFEVFHRLFFAGGTYTFDPRTDRLVQLFPEQFWFETSIAVGAVILALCAAVWWLAGRRAPVRSAEPAAAPAAPAASEPLR
ncbi:MAG: TIGR01906 family membrane protein [Chloroflexota bacterium]|nr:TIGR01906 family membrane protein [Chloroflexota bacterium]